MNKILSWKIKTGVYAYIYLPNSNTHISKRITEDSPLWRNIISSVSKWSDEEYRAHFNDMSSEVSKKYGKTISWNDDFLDFDGDNSYGGINIVMLAGEDADTKVNSILDGEISSTIEDFNAKIDAKLAAVTAEAIERNKEVKEFVDQKVNETIARATATINQTKEELSNIASEAMVSLSGATDAINKAAALFELGEGGIDSESIKDVVNGIKEQNEWINGLSGHVTDFKTDYDIARSMMGSIGTAEDATAGLFSRIATSLSVVSGTAGTVSSWMVASAGTIQDSATWYNTYESSVTEAVSYINASAGTIGDTLSYVNGEGVNSLKHEMNALSANIVTAISTSANNAVTRVEQNLNGLSGIVETTITRLNEADGRLTSIGEEFNGAKGEINKWLTITQNVSGIAHDLRDSWSAESGKLSTVANLLVEYDENGNPIYQAYKKQNGETTSEIIIVRKVSETVWTDDDGQSYEKDEVFLKYTTATQSYIKQEASALTLAVMETPEMTAQIALKLSEDDGAMKSIIDIVADEVNITADVIAKSLTTKEANIGGITIGNGRISTIVTDSLNNPTFKIDGNTGGFSATNAYISGHINATSLTIGKDYPQPIFDYINGMIPLFPNQSDITNLINDAIDDLNIDGRGYVTEDFVNDLLANNTGFTEEQTSFIQGLIGAKIPSVTTTDDGNGVITHTYTYVDIDGNQKTSEWKTVDTGEYIILGDTYNGSGGTYIFNKDGVLEADNAIIYGEIHAQRGLIGGFDISNDYLGFKDNDANQNIGFLSGKINHNEKQLIMASGIHNYLYVYEQDTNIIYQREIYSTKIFDISDSGKSLTLYDSYTYLDDGSIKFNDSDGDFIIVTDSDNNGNVITFIERTVGDYKIKYHYASRFNLNNTILTDANTKLYSDGTFETKIINAEGGFFGGEIDSRGKFSGELNGATGTIKMVEIDSCKLNCDVDINTTNTFRANGNNGAYLTVKNTALSNRSLSPDTYPINSYNWYWQNSNGTNAGKTITGSTRLSKAYFKQGALVLFENISGYISRYAATNKTNGECKIELTRTITYNNGSSTKKTLTQSQGSISGGAFKGTSKTTNINFKFDNFSAEDDGIVTIDLYFSCHLSTYYWLGMDKSCATINVNSNMISIHYETPPDGLYISPNGFRMVTPGGKALFSIIDDTIRLRTKNGYGIIIDESGIRAYYEKGGTPIQYIEYERPEGTRTEPFYGDIFTF